MSDDPDGSCLYSVVTNDEEQYSIWPADRAVPAGWKVAGPTARRDECLDYITHVWTDMRPLSARRRLDSERSGQSDG